MTTCSDCNNFWETIDQYLCIENQCTTEPDHDASKCPSLDLKKDVKGKNQNTLWLY